MIENPTAMPQPGSLYNGAMPVSSPPVHAGPPAYSGGYHAPVPSPAMRGHGYVDFKPSPFYKFQGQVGETKTLEGG